MERFLVGASLVVAAIIAAGSMFGSMPLQFNIEDGGPAVVQGAPVAKGTPATYAASEIEIRNAAAILVITPEDRTDVVLTVTGGDRLPALKVRDLEGRLVVDGGLGRRIRACGSGSPYSVTVADVGELGEADLPRIEIKTPRTIDMAVSGGVATTIGASDRATIGFAGCGPATIGGVKGALEVNAAGSGNIRIGSAQSAIVQIAGSSEVELGMVAQGLEASIAGSGSTRAKSVTGALDASIAGSGDVVVGGGAISKADVSIAGSGDVVIDAPVVDLEASIMGSGNVDVVSVSGAVERSIMGSGRVNIGPNGERFSAPPASPAPPPPQPPAAPPSPI